MPNAKPKGGKKWDGGTKKNSGGGDKKEVTIDGMPMSGVMGGGPMDSLSLMSMMSGGAVAGATGGAGTINVKMNPMQLMQYNQAMQV